MSSRREDRARAARPGPVALLDDLGRRRRSRRTSSRRRACPASRRMWAIRRVVVVLPFVPLIETIGSRRSASRIQVGPAPSAAVDPRLERCRGAAACRGVRSRRARRRDLALDERRARPRRSPRPVAEEPRPGRRSSARDRTTDGRATAPVAPSGCSRRSRRTQSTSARDARRLRGPRERSRRGGRARAARARAARTRCAAGRSRPRASPPARAGRGSVRRAGGSRSGARSGEDSNWASMRARPARIPWPSRRP